MNVKLQLFGIEETVIRPMVIQTLKDIGREIGCQTEPYLYLDQNSVIAKTRNRNKIKPTIDENSPIRKFAGKYKEFLRVNNLSDTVSPGYEIDYRINFPSTKPFILDREIKLGVNTIIQERKLDFTIEYTTTDNAYLNGVINALRLLPSKSECKFLHHLEYKLQIPTTIKRLLALVYKKKESRWEEHEKLIFSEYIRSITDDRLTTLRSPDGTFDKLEMAIMEKQMECLGMINTDVNSLKIEETEYGNTIELEYTLYVQIPVALNVNYPIVVYNHYLKKNEINHTPRNGRALNSNFIYGDLQWLRDNFMEDAFSDYYGTPRDYVKHPRHDDTMPYEFPNRLVRLMTSLFLVEENDRRNVGNFKDIKCVQFKPYVKEFILKSEYQHITRKNGSYLYFALYENEFLLDNVLEMDNLGNIRTTFDMDIKKTYRLVLFLLKDLDYLASTDRGRIAAFLNLNLERSRNFIVNKRAELKKEYGEGTVEFNTQIMTIQNEFLSTLDIFKDIYGLTPEDVQKVIKRYGHGVDVGDMVRYSNIKTPKTKQIFYMGLDRLFL